MRDDPYNITRQFTEGIFLGTGGPHALAQCRVLKQKAHLQQLMRGVPSSPGEVMPNRRARLILDTQYVNMPRCCFGAELSGLFLNQGNVDPWTDRAVQTLGLQHAQCGVRYVRAWPKEGTCTRKHKCPLVVQIAGTGNLVEMIGDPWLLVQSRCSACMDELKAVLVSPQMPQDVVGPDGTTMGTSNAKMRKTLIPFVEEMLHRHTELDRKRVYLTAQSRGVDTGIRAVLNSPEIFRLAIFSGMFMITNETEAMLSDDVVRRNVARAKLKEVQFHLGDLDRCFARDTFFSQFPHTLAQLGLTDKLQVTLRVYTESKHSVWYAAWNSMHDVIWTGQRPNTGGVPLTCAGRQISRAP